MSTPLTDGLARSAPTDARFAPIESQSKPRQSSNKSRVKLAYTTIWALDDMLCHAKKGRAQMEQMMHWIKRETIDAKGRYDSARLERIGELSALVAELALHVGELERLAADARLGIYIQPVLQPTEGTNNHGK